MATYSLKSLYAPAPKLTRGICFNINADPNGKKFIYAHGNAIYIRDLAQPEICESYHGHQTATTIAAYAPSGNYICSGDVSGKVIVWDALLPEHITKYEGKQLGGCIKDIAWNAESNRIAVAGVGNEKVVHAFMWDSGSSVGNMVGHMKAGNSISIRPVRPYRIATGSEDFLVNLYEGPPFKLKSQIREHSNFVNKVRYSPDGNLFCSGSSDGKVMLFEGKDGAVVACLGGDKAHAMGVTNLCWSPSGTQLLTASSDRTVKLWDVEANQCVTTFKLGERKPDDMQGSCLWAGEFMLSVSVNGNINYLDKNNPEHPLRVVKGHEKNITTLVTNDDNSKFYTTSYEGKCLRWNPAAFSIEECKGTGHTSQVDRSVRYKDRVYSVGIQRTLRCLDILEDQFTPLALPMESDPRDIAISKDGVLFVTCTNHLTVVKNDGIQNTIPIPFEATSAHYNDEMKQLVLFGKDKKLHVYTYGEDGKLDETHVTEELRDEGDMVRYSPDARFLAVTTGKVVLILDPREGFKEVESLSRASARVSHIEWSPDSKRIACAGLDSHIQIYEFGDPVKNTIIDRAHPASVIKGLQWIGDSIMSTGYDSCVKIWVQN